MWYLRVYAYGPVGAALLYEGDDAQTWMGDHAQAVRREGWAGWELKREFVSQVEA